MAIDPFDFFPDKHGDTDTYDNNGMLDEIINLIRYAKNEIGQSLKGISILILKSEMLDKHNISREDVLQKLTKLISFCELICSNFSYFFIRSRGNSVNVSESFVWSLRRNQS